MNEQIQALAVAAGGYEVAPNDFLFRQEQLEKFAALVAAANWQGLTDAERYKCTQSPFVAENYHAIEAALKEKNT